MPNIARRDFLKAASAAAGAGTLVAAARRGVHGDVRISGIASTPIQDYPIQPKPFAEVTITDTFWKRKIDTNAEVTIPFEVEKLSELERGFDGNVLEAAILSLKTHPNAQLQAHVEARVENLKQMQGAGNGGFEVAATYYRTTGKRDLLDPVIASADALYKNFVEHNPPFSGGERDAINCVQLYRVTHDKKHLDLAKHYLDIRGLDNSVNRSRHNQSYKPVLEQSDAVSHAVN